MSISLFDHEADFIKNLPQKTGRSLEEWFELLASSGQSNFHLIRAWLVSIHQLDTPTATTITQLFLEDFEKNAPQVTFSQEGRGGNFTYKSKEGSFSSWWEFGGGDALAILNVPSEQYWETKTGIPLAKRAAVLDFIGRGTVQQQTASGRGSFKVDGDFILVRS